jgi:cytochrome c oxidase cbb3-type subunit IV
MLKFIKHHMSVEGIEIFPLISFLLFFAFFVIVLIYVFRKDKQHIQEMSNLPLEGDNTDLP